MMYSTRVLVEQPYVQLVFGASLGAARATYLCTRHSWSSHILAVYALKPATGPRSSLNPRTAIMRTSFWFIGTWIWATRVAIEAMSMQEEGLLSVISSTNTCWDCWREDESKHGALSTNANVAVKQVIPSGPLKCNVSVQKLTFFLEELKTIVKY